MTYWNRRVTYNKNNKRLDITFIKQDILGGFNTPLHPKYVTGRGVLKAISYMILPYSYLNNRFLKVRRGE